MKGAAPAAEASARAPTAGNVRLWHAHRRKIALIQNAVPRHKRVRPLNGSLFIFRKAIRSIANPGSQRRPARSHIVRRCSNAFVISIQSLRSRI